MPTIDDKVVAMSFENSKFESGVKTTINSLDKLKNSLQFTNAGKGLNSLGSSINGLGSNIRPLNKSIDSVRAHFSALNVAASAIIGHIAIQLTDVAERAIKAFTIGPIIQGLQIYNTKLQATQTILANTQAAGTNMKDVNAALNQLNIYANKTIFSFGEMTKNIGTFTAAGVGLKPAVSAIKGIANLAALSGSNSEQASTAMYQLSQAISAGRVSLQDWNSVVNAGLGGSVFQRALVQTAVAMGKLSDKTVKLVGPMKNVQVAGESFRQSIQAGPGKTSWLTGDVLTKTLSTFTGDMTDAQLAASGFNKQQIKDIQATAKTAVNAATQVKTFSQLMDVTKESIATGWSQSFELVLGNLTQAKKLFTDISNSFSGVINKSANTRNKILGDWSKLGGRTKLIAALKEIFQALGDVLRPVRDAFRDIFPRRTGRDLFNLTTRFKEFADTLKPTQTTIDNLRRTFRGVFAVLDIGKQIIGGIIGVFAHLFGTVAGGSGSFLKVTGNIGDFLVSVDLALKKGKGLENFFNGLGRILAVPIKLFGEIAHAVANMFNGFSPGPFSVNMDIATKATEPFHKALKFITDALQGLGPAISNAVQNMNFEAILAVIRTGLLAAIVLMIRKFIGGTNLERVLGLFGSKIGSGFAKNLGGGILGNLSKSFGSLTGSLKAMQQNLQAKTLEAIAISIALLAASVVALSFVKPKRLNAALTAMAIGFGELIGVMVALNKLLDTKATAKMPVIAASLVVMATAMDILAVAVFALGKLKGSELAKGLGAIAILLGTLTVAAKFLAKGSVGLAVAGVALNEIAVALNIMALAVLQFGRLDLVTLGKGLLGVAGSLTAIGLAMKLMPLNMVVTSAGLVVVAVALNILAKAVSSMGSMNLETIGKGLLGIGAGLVIIAGAMQLMPISLPITAAGLFIVAVALNEITKAVGSFGGMSLGELAKGLTSLAISLGILAVALGAMSGELAGAAALTIAAVGVSLLAKALVSLGQQSWTSILKSLISLAAGLGLIALAGVAVTPAIPALLGFGAALVLIGAGLALAGAGVALIGIGLSAIAIAGPTAIGILIQALEDLTKSIQENAINLVKGLLAIVQALAKTAPQFVKAIVKIVDMLAEAIIKSAPKVAEAFVVILVSALEALDKHGDEIIQAGIDILEKLLQGIAQNIGDIVTMAATIVVNLVDSLAKNANRLISAGFDLVISLVKGITDNIGKLYTAGVDIIAKFLNGIGKDVGKVIKAGANLVISLVTAIGNNLYRVVKAGTNAIVHFITGLGQAGQQIITAGTNVIIKLLNALASNNTRLINAGFRAIVKYLNGIADAIDQHEPELIHAGIRIGKAIVTGMIKGLADEAGGFIHKAGDIAKSGLSKIGGIFGIHSPSRETFKIGRFVVQGLVNGIDQTAPKAEQAVTRLSKSLLDTMNNVSFNDLLHTEPTITPILDLSNVQNGSKKLQGIIDKSPLGSVSLNHAATISMRQAQPSTDVATPDAAGQVIKFEQNNYSPKPIGTVEIYRRTRNQLSLLKAKTR